jgi:HIP---CoA ligase
VPAGLRLPEQDAARKGGDTIYSSLADSCSRSPDHAFLRHGEQTVTYAEVLARSDEMAARLEALGVGCGARVVVWLPNGVEWATAFFACARLGAVAVMAGTRLRAVDLRHILADARAHTLLFTPEFLGADYEGMVETLLRARALGALPDLENVVSTAETSVAAAVSLPGLPARVAGEAFGDGGAPALVCYTSGTTGRPKGCVHDHETLLANASIAAGLSGLGPDDRIVCPVPFAHVFGFHMGVLQATVAGATLVNAEPYSGGERLLDLVERERGTVLYGVPTMVREAAAGQRARRRDLDSLRLTLVAGAPVAAALREAIGDPGEGLGSQLCVVYGCTEAPTLTQLLPGDPPLPRLKSVGRPTPGVELRIAGEATGEPVGPGEVGDVLARGYNQMVGYLDDEAATAAKFSGEWLVTGDRGWLDADGFLYLAGRSSEMFLVGGFNAYPREIESQLEELEGVLEAVVVGVPDERLGSVPMAWITATDSSLSEDAALEWARKNLASYKRPRYLRIVSSLPRTPSGKISRVKVERLARRALPRLDWEAREA